MGSILKKMWEGQIEAQADFFKPSAELKKRSQRLQSIREKLCRQLTEEQQELLETYDAAFYDVMEQHEFQGFCYGFRMSAKLMTELLQEEKPRPNDADTPESE